MLFLLCVHLVLFVAKLSVCAEVDVYIINMGALGPQLILIDIPNKLCDVLQLEIYHCSSYSAV